MDSFYWVIENCLAGMSEPKKNDLPFLQTMGIKGVVSLIKYDDTNPSIKDSPWFSVFEFLNPDNAKMLCQAIESDDYNIDIKNITDTVDWLNELLKMPDFYESISSKRDKIPSSYRINYLIETTDNIRSEEFRSFSSFQKRIIQELNRLLIESIYPDLAPSGLQMEDLYRNAGIDYLYLPIFSMCPPTLEQTASFVKYVDKMKSEGKPVAVHCLFGRGRTGTMLTAYLICTGIECDKAIAMVKKENPYAIESISQIDFLGKLKLTDVIM